MSTFCFITHEQMDRFLTRQGFQIIYLPNVKEMVYSKLIDKNICIRVYTSIVNGVARDSGNDAIRVAVVKRIPNGAIRPISYNVSKVYRTENWKANLQKRLDSVANWYYTVQQGRGERKTG